MSGPADQASAVARAYRAAAPWLSATWQFVGAALVGVLVGWGVDQWLGSTKGYGVVVGGLLGSTLGCVAFIRSAMKLLETKQ
ncbi:MAG: AtpZ/AtpI family protein [Myxococcaceae bacterium]